MSGCHSFEAPLTEISPTIESWEGVSITGYSAALFCASLLGREVLRGLDFSVWMLSVYFLLLAGTGYFGIYARARSGNYYIIRNTREPGRDIWVLRTGNEQKVEEFVRALREKIAHVSS